MTRLHNTSTILSIRKVRLAAPVIVAAFVLAGCSSIGGGDAGALYAVAKNYWTGNSGKVTLAEAAAVPYASLGVSVGGDSETMIVLAGDADGQRLWTSSAKIAITTKDGRIMRTAGFEHNLGGYEPRGDTLVKDGVRIVHWQADFPDLNLYSVPITCQDREAGTETIVILGKDIHTRRIDESCASQVSQLGWSFKNIYWVDPESGLTWRSIQHVHPRLDAIETEILRPPA